MGFAEHGQQQVATSAKQRRARDWMCDCGAIALGSSHECFMCGLPKPAGARSVVRQVTDAADAGPPPTLAPMAQADIHIASAEAASTVEATRPAAYYAATAAQKGSFCAQTFRTAALNRVISEQGALQSKARDRCATSKHGRCKTAGASTPGEHKAAIDQLKAEQQARREAAESQKAEERRERERRRQARVAAQQLPFAVGSPPHPGEAAPAGPEPGVPDQFDKLDLADERRIDLGDGKAYTHAEFVSFYGGSEEWIAAAPIRSDC